MRFRAPTRGAIAVATVAAVAMALGWLQKRPCRDGWVGSEAYRSGCYTDLVPLWWAERLVYGDVPYLDYPVEYPVLIGAVMYLAASAARWLDPAAGVTAFFDLSWLMLAACGVVVATATLPLLRSVRGRYAALAAVTPAVVLAGFVNWDLLAVALLALSMLLWARRRPAVAGILLGAAVAAKFYPVVVLGPMLVLCLRAGALRAWVRYAVCAAGAWVVLNLPVALLAPQLPMRDGSPGTVNGWWEFFRFNRERGADWGSVWFWVQSRTDLITGPGNGRVDLLAGVALLVACLAIAALALLAPRRPRVGQLVFLTVAAFVLTAKVYSPQYVLWLVPLAVLALPRWRPLLVWQVAEVVYFAAIWRYLWSVTEPGAGISQGTYFLALGARSAGVLLLCVLVVVDVLRPARDVVRRDGLDDPAGGVIDGAPDRRHLRGRPNDGPHPAGTPAPDPRVVPDPGRTGSAILPT